MLYFIYRKKNRSKYNVYLQEKKILIMPKIRHEEENQKLHVMSDAPYSNPRKTKHFNC